MHKERRPKRPRARAVNRSAGLIDRGVRACIYTCACVREDVLLRVCLITRVCRRKRERERRVGFICGVCARCRFVQRRGGGEGKKGTNKERRDESVVKGLAGFAGCRLWLRFRWVGRGVVVR